MNIIITVFGSLLGAAAVWLTSQYLTPLVSSWISNAPKLPATWVYKDDIEGEVVGTAELKQFGSRITIKAKRTRSRKGKEDHRAFTYHGTIKERTLIATFSQDKSNSTVSGSLVLRVSANCREMKGVTSYFSDNGGVVSHEIFYFVQ